MNVFGLLLRQMRTKVIALGIIIAAVSACSTRVEYDRSSAYGSSTNSININVASADELEKLPGIGRKTADAIIAFRNENGRFRQVEHVMLIRGVSEARFLELRPYLRAD